MGRVKFKPEYRKKLDDLKISTKFESKWHNSDWKKRYPKTSSLEGLNSQPTWRLFISNAFLWMGTEEHDYWNNIADK